MYVGVIYRVNRIKLDTYKPKPLIPQIKPVHPTYDKQGRLPKYQERHQVDMYI